MFCCRGSVDTALLKHRLANVKLVFPQASIDLRLYCGLFTFFIAGILLLNFALQIDAFISRASLTKENVSSNLLLADSLCNKLEQT